MTMFENVTRALTRQLNPRGDLTPLDSLIDFKRFHPFCLVLRKRKSTLFWGARYIRTDYTFLDILEPGSSPSGQPWPRTWGPRDGLEPANQEDLKLSLPSGQGWESSSQKVLEGGREEEAPLSPAPFIVSLLQTQQIPGTLALRICWTPEWRERWTCQRQSR